MTPTVQTSITPSETIPVSCTWPWVPDLGNGHYRNPILHADYSDPDVIRHGEDFYLTASSFNCTPGLPILHSRDLVNWRLIAHAVKNLPHPRYEQVQPGCGIWAPAMRFHAGRFWIFFPMPDEGIYVTTAEHPAGNWSEPHLVQAGAGLIDPCPLWDYDGKAYLVHAYAASRAGIKNLLRVCPMEPDGSRLLGEGQIVFHEPDRHPTIEGPKFLKRDGWYYILAPAGGVATGWQVALRSKNIFGPYEDKIVLAQGSTPINGPHQGALVDTPSGEWWFVHFQDTGVYGRIVHLQPVCWQDGWPLMGCRANGDGLGNPVLTHTKPKVTTAWPTIQPATSDEFDGARLGPQWQWNANHRDDWYSLSARPGWLRLYSHFTPESDLTKAPPLLLQKFPAREFAVEACLDATSISDCTEAGLVVTGSEHGAIAIARSGNNWVIRLRVNGTVTTLQTTSSSSFRLKVAVTITGKCVFSYAIDDAEFTAAPGVFHAREGVWIGAKVGLYCLQTDAGPASHADISHFRFTP